MRTFSRGPHRPLTGPGDEPSALEGMRGEWRMLRRLAHPNLVHGFGAGLDAPRPHTPAGGY